MTWLLIAAALIVNLLIIAIATLVGGKVGGIIAIVVTIVATWGLIDDLFEIDRRPPGYYDP